MSELSKEPSGTRAMIRFVQGTGAERMLVKVIRGGEEIGHFQPKTRVEALDHAYHATPDELEEWYSKNLPAFVNRMNDELGWQEVGRVTEVTKKGHRRRLSDTRPSMTVKLRHGNMEGYLIVGFYDNDQPGEVFVNLGKQGSFVQATVDMAAMQASYLLQFGVPLSWVASKWRGHRFEPIDAEGHSIFDTIAAAMLKACSDRGSKPDLNCDLEEVILG